ncbi:PREDICTED: neuropeptide FF receptor 2-like [Branchiostoma belcheri]|uniref:Neuropeptide FF receptor 2-like n=1 Tax=Branchiostoma belcheri TaxID=7741 RepID=A0A6P4YKS4_BRABE|nr:PREDICTED: neuropeptide FF receptor 2-like [Branchiostoma belcheri]
MENETGPSESSIAAGHDDHNGTWDHEDLFFDKYKQGTAFIVVFILAYLSVFLLCVVGNLLVIVVVALNRNMRTVTNFFIANLAAADLLVGVFSLPFNLADSILTSWPFGEAMCKTFLTVRVLSVSASVFTLVAIAVDRYYAVVHPTSPRFTKTAMMYILSAVWIVAAATSAPQGLVLTSVTYEGLYTEDGQLLTACEEVWPGDYYVAGYTFFLFAICYVFPLFIIALLYIKIGRSIWNRSKPGTNHDTQKKLHVIRMLLVVVVVFTLSWLPLYSLLIATLFSNLTDTTAEILYHYVSPIVKGLAFINCGVNPVIYGYYNKNLRKGFSQLIGSTA